jgi:hypothetical protein
MPNPHRQLHIKFHGRIIDHLGIQMYQSPTAAIAELIANSWDADAEMVLVTLPDALNDDATIVIEDNGTGMTFDDCEERYLNVGYGRRGNDPNEKSPGKNRPILGRKGIGKFAGFGIAKIIRVETVSGETGEKTVFELDINTLRGEEYVAEGGTIDVIEYLEPDEARKTEHGTRIILKTLMLGQRPSPTVFAKSMGRRFLLHQRADDFLLLINGTGLPDDEEGSTVEFIFPKDYTDDDKPANLTIDDDGWGEEKLSNGQSIKWRFQFYEKPINDEELQGVSIFTHGKLAQTPFFFNLTGGLGGQHGQEYLSGQVQADYLDELETDIISPERQRINWGLAESLPLLEWGQARVKSLFEIWKRFRAEKKVAVLDQKLTPFGERLGKLPNHDQKIIRRALLKLAAIPTLGSQRFVSLAESLLLAWEGGRLKDLIDTVGSTEDMSEGELLGILVEANVLTALHTAEAVKAKLLVIAGLHERIKNRELENAVRDYIAKDPWLVSPQWEFFQKELSVQNLVKAAAKTARLDESVDWEKRVDLVLSSGDTLLIIEFMRPGLTIDWDHIERFDQYVTALRVQLEGNTALQYKKVVGYLVADNLARTPIVLNRLNRIQKDDMYALDWETLLRQATVKWKDFLDVLITRAPEDDRLRALAQDLNLGIHAGDGGATIATTAAADDGAAAAEATANPVSDD